MIGERPLTWREGYFWLLDQAINNRGLLKDYYDFRCGKQLTRSEYKEVLTEDLQLYFLLAVSEGA